MPVGAHPCMGSFLQNFPTLRQADDHPSQPPHVNVAPLSIARVIEPAVATKIEPARRVPAARFSVASGQHLRWQDVGEEDGLVAVRAEPTKAEATAEDVAVRAATLTEEASLAGGALVDRLADEGWPAPGFGRRLGERRRYVQRAAKPVGALLAGVGAVASAGRDGATLADRAEAPVRAGAGRLGVVTRTVTHGSWWAGITRHRLASTCWRCLGARRAR